MRNNTNNCFILRLNGIVPGKYYFTRFILLLSLFFSFNKSDSQNVFLSKQVFNYTGADQILTIPNCATQIKIKIWAAGGGGSAYNSANAGGGAGGYVEGFLAVSPGDVFSVMVGEGGACDGTSDVASYGFGGSYSSPNYGGFGGGLSGIFTGNAAITQTDQSRALLIAGGGGGSERGPTPCSSGGQGGDITFGGGMPDMKGEGPANLGGGGGGGYSGGLMSLRLSNDGITYAGEGGTNFINGSITSGVSLSSSDFGSWNASPAMYKEPPNVSDADYTAWVNSSNPGIGTGSMYTYFKAGHGRVVIEFYRAPLTPTISIIPASVVICQGMPVSFTAIPNNSGANPVYQWQLNGLNVSGATSTAFTSSTLNNGDIIGVVLSSDCADTVSSTDTVIVHPNPVAGFNNTTICNGNTTLFTDISTTTSGTVSNWTWGFGDGSPVNNSQSPSHLYSGSGNYTTNLIVKNSFGCADTITKPIAVYYSPTAAFTHSDVCFGNTMSFTNTSIVDTSSISYLWIFGDNSATSGFQSPDHYYSNAGTDTVTLITTTINGCSDTAIVNVTISPTPLAIANSNSPVPIGSSINLLTDTVSGIVWAGPNGFTSTLQNPVISNAQLADSGLYQVIKTNSFGCKDTAYMVVSVYQPEIPDNGIDDDGDGLIDCADPDLATLHQCYRCGYDSIAWQTVIPEPGFNKGIAVKYTGFVQHFTVPAGVTSIKVKAWGAGGGGGYLAYNAAAGAGGFTVDQLVTIPAETYVVITGEGGWATRAENQTARATFGFGGSGNSMGAAATSETGSGGGLSGLFFDTFTQTNARVVAGGGGGMADAGGLDETSGGNGNTPLSGGYLPLTGENAMANSTGFGGGGGGYVGGISGISRFSYPGHLPDTFADGGEGGSGYKYTSGGLIKYTTELNIYPPDTSDVHYLAGVGVGNDYNMPVGALGDIKTGGNGLMVIQWFEPIADLIITATKDSICKGDTLSLTASGQSNYLWSPASTLSSDTAKTVIASPTVDITYQVISNDNNCKDTAQINIVVHPLPVLVLSPDSSICRGNSLQLNVAGASSYSWFPGYGLDTTSGTIVTASPLITTQYYVTGIDNNNCSSTDSIKITIDSLPIASITGIASICAGDSTLLTASGGVSYLWSTGATCVAIKIAPSSTTSYSVIVKNNNGCIDSALFNEEVHAIPSPQFSAANVCDGSNADFIDLSTINPPDTIQSYSWNFGDGSALSNVQNPSHLFAADSSYSVQLLVVSNFGCSDSISKIITVNPKPIISFTADDTIGCDLLCVSFQNSSSINTGNNLEWLWDFGDGSATSNLENPDHCYNNNASPLSFTVILTVTSDSGCIGTLSKNNYITVNPNPTAQFSTANVCEGNNVLFTDLSTIPTNETIQSFTWNFGDGSPVNSYQSVPGGHLYTFANFYNLSLVVVSNSGCKDSISKVVTVNPNPVVNFTASDTIGCEPLCISFQNFSTVLTGLNVQWAWNVGDGSAVNNSQTFDHCYTNDSLFAPNYFYVTLAVTSDSGCVGTLSKNNYITVYPAPDASFTVQPQTAIITNPVISITDVSTGTNFWNWNFGDPLSVLTDTSSVSNPGFHAYSDTGTYTITLITSTLYNCTDTAYETIIIEPDFLFYIPNAFTPDGDGVNDSFTGKGIYIKELEMTIFDRWGNLIYRATDINKPWDGIANHGTEIAQADVYVYVIKVTDFKMVKHNYKGKVTLLR